MAAAGLGRMSEHPSHGKLAYKLQGRIGGGSFGDVFRALHLQSGAVVAIKRVFERAEERGVERPDPSRELRVLQAVKHDNVLPLLDSFTGSDGSQMLVSPLMTGGTLRDVLVGLGEPLDEAAAKGFLVQLLRGLAHLHTNHNVIHRDLKSSNLLLDEGGSLVIADFGQARWLPSDAPNDESSVAAARISSSGVSTGPGDAERPMTPHTGTRWLRAPELLFGARSYGAAVDIWAVGCIAMELLTGVEPFRAEADIVQIARIADSLGFPTAAEWPELSSLPDGGKLVFAPRKAATWEHLLPARSAACRAFVGSCLSWRARERPTAEQLLASEWLVGGAEGASVPLLPPLLPHCAPAESAAGMPLPVVVVRSEAAVAVGMALPGAWAASEALAIAAARAAAHAQTVSGATAAASAPMGASSARVAVGGSSQMLALFDRPWDAETVAAGATAAAAVWTEPLSAVAAASLT